MIVWISKEAVGANTDQRAVVEGVIGESLCVRLLGTNERLGVMVRYVTGIEISDHLTIQFKYTGHIVHELFTHDRYQHFSPAEEKP